MMVNIAIGTVSHYKCAVILKVLHGLEFEFTYSSVAADSGISEQPHTLEETLTGSINRTKHALILSPQADISIGVEFGYEPFDSHYRMICWSTIATRDGRLFSEHSSSLELPKIFENALHNDIEVYTYMQEVRNMLPENEQGRTFNKMISKRTLINESLRNALLRYRFDSMLY